MSRYIVTTTINPPTEAVERFDALADWELIVVGDEKTPKGYRLRRGTYVAPREQESYDRALSDVIGWGCIQRRNLGTLMAFEAGAEVIAVVDDDNIPEPGWGADLVVGRQVEANFYETELPAFDPLGATNHPHLWHRGYPLPLLSRRDYSRSSRRAVVAQVQADLWNGDPDVDAVCRMEHAPECKFDATLFPIASNAPAPFNSQNTFLARDVLPDYFLFPGVGRMDDIWAAYHAQARGHRVIFCAPSVYQARNTHDPIQDLRAELLGYEHNLALLADVARDPSAILGYLPGRAAYAFALWRRRLGRA